MLKVYIYRPDKALYENENIKKEHLYSPDGKTYKEPKQEVKRHPLEIIHRHKITSSYIEVDR